MAETQGELAGAGRKPNRKKIKEHVEKIENGDIIDDIQYYRKVELDNSSVVTLPTKYGNIGVKKILTINDFDFYISDNAKLKPKQLHEIKKAYDLGIKMVGLKRENEPICVIVHDRKRFVNEVFRNWFNILIRQELRCNTVSGNRMVKNERFCYQVNSRYDK